MKDVNYISELPAFQGTEETDGLIQIALQSHGRQAQHEQASQRAGSICLSAVSVFLCAGRWRNTE